MHWSHWTNHTAVSALHLLGGVPVPGVVFIFAVLLSPELADLSILLEVLALLLHSVLVDTFSDSRTQ